MWSLSWSWKSQCRGRGSSIDTEHRDHLLRHRLRTIFEILDFEDGILVINLELVSLIPEVQEVRVHELLEAKDFSSDILGIVESILRNLHDRVSSFSELRKILFDA